MTNLNSILKSRDITWSAKIHLVEAMVSPVVMYGCESWTIRSSGEDSSESLGLQGNKTSHPEGNQP